MSIQGYRKLIMLAMVLATVALLPNMTPAQSDALTTAIIAVFGANGVEHVAGAIKNAGTVRNRVGSGVSSVRPVSYIAPAAVPGDDGAH
jgi:hypothetical protein